MTFRYYIAEFNQDLSNVVLPFYLSSKKIFLQDAEIFIGESGNKHQIRNIRKASRLFPAKKLTVTQKKCAHILNHIPSDNSLKLINLSSICSTRVLDVIDEIKSRKDASFFYLLSYKEGFIHQPRLMGIVDKEPIRLHPLGPERLEVYEGFEGKNIPLMFFDENYIPTKVREKESKITNEIIDSLKDDYVVSHLAHKDGLFVLLRTGQVLNFVTKISFFYGKEFHLPIPIFIKTDELDIRSNIAHVMGKFGYIFNPNNKHVFDNLSTLFITHFNKSSNF